MDDLVADFDAVIGRESYVNEVDRMLHAREIARA